jgi:predicted Zn-dependent peptidase
MSVFNKTLLTNGVRVLTENHPDSKAVVVGFWIQAGTRFESKKQEGISHLLEHMVFKGTEKYSAYDIARSLEARGGDINAFTGREHTCFHTTSLKQDLDLSIDVLSQLFAFARFKEEEFTKEKRVVLQEILMASDDLEEYTFDLFFEKAFPQHPLGFQILGSPQSVSQLSLSDIQHHYEQSFVPENLIVSVVGSVDHDEVVNSVEQHLRAKQWSQSRPALTPPQPAPAYQPVHDFQQKDCEQFHLLLSFPACAYTDPDRFNGFILNTALGGGMTSRLYQKVREDRGLVYSIFSMLNTFTDTGIQTIYAGTEENHVHEVIDLVLQELGQVQQQGLSEEDLELFKTQTKGQIIIGSEDIDSRMNSLAINEMVFGHYRSVDEVISDIDKINTESLMKYIQKTLKKDQIGLFTMGKRPISTIG